MSGTARSATRFVHGTASGLRLFGIEFRRNLGLLLFLPAVVGLVSTSFDVLPRGVWLWGATAGAIRGSLVLAGPVAAGLAAWVAGRNRRRGMEEMLAITPRPAASEASEAGMFEAQPESWSWSEDEPCVEPAGPDFVAQQVFAEWLARRAGASEDGYGLGLECPESKAALGRFGNLDPAEPRAWLLENYADLRVGKLELEDLP